MRSFLMMGLAFLVLGAFVGTASADWSDDFESYAPGSGLHGQGGWHGWDGNPAADAYISASYSHSPSNSVAIAAASDMVHEFSGYTSGVNTFTAWQYIPSDFSGITYCILLNQYQDGGPYNWSTQVSFDSGSMLVISDPQGATLPLIMGQWIELQLVIDLDANTQTFYYNGTMLFTKSWTEGLSGGGTLNIAALDLFANGASPVYYDDVSLMIQHPTPVVSTSWGRVKGLFR